MNNNEKFNYIKSINLSEDNTLSNLNIFIDIYWEEIGLVLNSTSYENLVENIKAYRKSRTIII